MSDNKFKDFAPGSLTKQLADGKLHADKVRGERELSEAQTREQSETAQQRANEASRKAAEEIGRNAIITE